MQGFVGSRGENVRNAPHTPQKTMPRRSRVWWYGARRDLPAPLSSLVARSASPFGRLVPTWIALHFILVHCASLAEWVFFIAVHCASVAKGVFFYAGPFCNIRQCLLTHKHFPSVVVSGQHGGARRGSPLHFAEAAGPTTLCTVLDVTCSQPSFGHMARNVLQHLAAHNFFAASFSFEQVCVVTGARALVAQRWPPR